MAKNFESLFKLAQEKGPKKMAVAVAQDEDVLGAIKLAYEKGIVEPILVGDKDIIEKLAKDLSFDLSKVEIVDEKDGVEATRKATAMVSSGKAQVLMKGLIDTSVIMKAVLDKEIGLRTDSVISHVAVFDVPTYHKVFMVTDAAMIIAPDLEQKKKIIENAVKLAHSLDIAEPKVAVLAAKEKVSPKMEATVHAKELADMNKAGEITGCIVDGPFALDNAISKASADHKGVSGPVAGVADILAVSDIRMGNVLHKAITYFAQKRIGSVIIGTKSPIVMTSRSDSVDDKLVSIAASSYLSSQI